MGILQTALTAYNNDLYASNLVHLPILAIHGTDDDNVPPPHSRKHVGLVQAWQGKSEVDKLVEVPKKGHWWDDVLKLPEVYRFIEEVHWSPAMSDLTWREDRMRGYTLSTANPDESGCRSGVSIMELRTPGRLARLDVKSRIVNGTEVLNVKGTNVKRISYCENRSFHPDTPTKVLTLTDNGRGYDTQTIETFEEHKQIRRHGPVIRLLATSGPISIIVDTSHTRSYSIAKRYAHDLYVYHRLAVNIVSDKEAVEGNLSDQMKGNLVIIGRPEENEYTRLVLKCEERPFNFRDRDKMTIGGREVDDQGAGMSLGGAHREDQLKVQV